MQLAQVGGVPMQQVQMRGVDYVGPQAEGQVAKTMGQILDRMSSALFEHANKLRQEEAFQFAIENPPTADQLQKASSGTVDEVFKELKLSKNPISVYGKMLNKVRAQQVAQSFELEGRQKLVEILGKVETGQINADQARTEINTAINGFGNSLQQAAIVGQLDSEAGLKFKASMASHGNTVYQSALTAQIKRDKEVERIKVMADVDNVAKLIESRIRIGTGVDPLTQQEIPLDRWIDLSRRTISDTAKKLGDSGLYREQMDRFEKMVRDAKINVLTQHFTQEQYLSNPKLVAAEIQAGNAGTLSPVLQQLMEQDRAAVIAVINNNRTMAEDRRRGIELSYVDANEQGKNILRQIYASTNPSEQRKLYSTMRGLAVDPNTLKSARDFINSDSATGPQRDDLEAFGRISQRVSLGLATSDEIIKAPLTRSTKKQLLQQMANATDDLGYGVNQINLAVGIQSSNLPPEMKSAEARQLAVETRNQLQVELYTYARTPKDNGMLPSAPEIRAKGEELAKKAKGGMSKAFNASAENDKNTAALFLRELQGVDLNNEQAVADAFAKATARKAKQSEIDAAKAAVDSYRNNIKRAQEGQQQQKGPQQ